MEVIVPLIQQHCQDVAQLHLQFLSTGFQGKFGLRLLQLYYMTVAQETGACGYVAQENGLTIGYVCGVWNAAEVRSHLVKNHWPSLVLLGILQVIVSPRILFDLPGRFFSRPDARHMVGHEYELRPIVVTPSARGTRVAAKLVETLVADADSRGFEQLYLYTDVENAAARRFYAKVGFVQAGEVSRSGKRHTVHTRSVKSAL